MAGQYPLPPVAVFREPVGGAPVPELGPVVREAAALAAGQLARVATHGHPGRRVADLGRAEAATDRLVEQLRVEGAPLSGDELPAQSMSQSYFRVRESELTDSQAAMHGAMVVRRALADLQHAPLSGSDMAFETAALRRALLDLTAAVEAPAAEEPAAEAAADAPLEAEWRARWIIGHQAHVLFNICAATAIRDAVHHLRQGAVQSAARRLGAAVVHVQGFPAAMAHASAMPAEHYLAAVRPTMMPPEEPRPLSGRMHRGYKLFRAAVKELLTVLPEPYALLASRAPELAAAREDLLEADLVDSERHITLAYSMVALRPSIAQPDDGPANAVRELRRIRHQRAARYAPLVRYPDELAALGLADAHRGAAARR